MYRNSLRRSALKIIYITTRGPDVAAIHVEMCCDYTFCTVQNFEVAMKITHVFKKFSNSSAKLSPTASLTTGTSPFICIPLALFLLRVLVVAASSIASSASSPNVSASAVLRGVECPFVLGCGALLGGKDERGAAGDDEGSKSIAVVRGWARTRNKARRVAPNEL